ncbi:phage terminase small subunit [Rhodoblastus acidophilus]|uniref:terminase small subunit n=1 Tax=Rhodoblastus acidophilus TaxID=1074 RepID=UPI002224C3AD|nr:terminase small subunit [Rhodoblastus acidophilus]MCW2286072.1 phage terminase small subunit [Rhodoblastus acidophilus]MCW2334966.1 phage terminase small subunit [Rhodoblastus acidophilus]
MERKKQLTPKQQRFVEEYAIDANATQAAIRAGYSPRTAGQIGERLLKKVEIAAAVSKAQKTRSERTEITADRIAEELAQIAFANVGDYFEWGPDGITVCDKGELTREQQSAVAEVAQTFTKDGGSIRVKLHDKLGALDKLTKLLGYDKQRGSAENPLHLLVQQLQGNALPVKP